MVLHWSKADLAFRSHRCLGHTKDGSRCKLKTRADDLCWMHQEKIKGLRVKNSPIAGLGLFAVKEFKKGEQVTEYKGEILNRDELDRRYPGDRDASYVYQMNRDKFIDARKPTSCLGRFINAPTRGRGNVETPYAHKKEQRELKIRAIKNIQPGEELLLKYGNGPGLGYEGKPKPNKKKSK